MNIIQIRNVNKKYKTGVMAVNDLSLDIEKGEFVFVIGSTGCGKSTLIKMLYREEKPTSGKVEVVGQDVSKIKKTITGNREKKTLENDIKKVEKKTKVDKNTILSLAEKLQKGNMKDEKTLNEVIDTLSGITGKPVSDEKRKKIMAVLR